MAFISRGTHVDVETLDTKIRRKGFTLVPDYASTAFMIQGATIPAGIADCSDITDFGGLSELMTTYVILSRVKSVDGLLLLRAYCRNMFAIGALPGPTCLMKLLRHRFSGTAHGCRQNEAHEFPGAAHVLRHVELYTTAEAVAEYQLLMAVHDAWRKQRREFGPDWRCCDCSMHFPAAGYGVGRHETFVLCEKVEFGTLEVLRSVP